MDKKDKYFTLSNCHNHILGLFSILSLSVLTMVLLVLVIHLSLADTIQVRAQSPENEGIKDFVANGSVNSTIYTLTGNWVTLGNWELAVSDGRVTSFNTDMVWNNGTAGHTHEFRNFVADDDDTEASPDGTVIIQGEMDVGSNREISWRGIPAEIFIDKGKIITVSLDDEGTNKHFGGQSIHGTVDALTPCNLEPGPDMIMPTSC